MGETVSDVGEFVLIGRITAVLDEVAARAAAAERSGGPGGPAAPAAEVLLGPGDDAALLRIRTGHVVVSTDLMVEGRHFRRDWVDAADVGHRAAAQNLSDVNAMGGRAHSLTVGLAVPGDLPVAWVLDLVRGFAEEAALVGARVVGGDLTRADEVVVAVTVMGSCTHAPVLRSGAREGDVVALAGRQGWAAGGLAVLGRGFRSPRALVDAYRRPEPPYAAGPAAAAAGATAMLDVSDGLLAEAGHVAVASGVRIDLRSTLLDVPEPLVAIGSALGADPLRYVLAGGDDHPLLATFPAGTELPAGFRGIGAVLAPDDTAPRVTVDGQPWEGPAGWDHFTAG